jgi:thiaminase
VYYIKLKDVFEKIILESKRLSFFLNNDTNFQSEMVRMIDIAKKHRDETTELIKLSNPAIDAVRDFLNEVNSLLKISKCELCAKYPLYKVDICEEECETEII